MTAPDACAASAIAKPDRLGICAVEPSLEAEARPGRPLRIGSGAPRGRSRRGAGLSFPHRASVIPAPLYNLPDGAGGGPEASPPRGAAVSYTPSAPGGHRHRGARGAAEAGMGTAPRAIAGRRRAGEGQTAREVTRSRLLPINGSTSIVCLHDRAFCGLARAQGDNCTACAGPMPLRGSCEAMHWVSTCYTRGRSSRASGCLCVSCLCLSATITRSSGAHSGAGGDRGWRGPSFRGHSMDHGGIRVGGSKTDPSRRCG